MLTPPPSPLFVNVVYERPLSDVLWSEVRHVWGNQRNPAGLKNFLGGEKIYILKYVLTSSPSKYDKIKTVGKWGIWTPTGVLVGYYPPTLGVGVLGSLDPPKGV